MSNDYRVAIYLRLSRDDGNEESQSIQTQREMLTKFVNKNGWKIFDEYVDDGYTGTNFNRPDFQRMINDIESGVINMVVTKDLSRLGRNYILVGYYTEEYFPSKNVRYIAINDLYDSIKEDCNDFVPLRNYMNEWYAKDTSKKIRSILNEKAKNGEPKRTCVPIYGYAFNDKNERIPDSETAPIVKLIFDKFIELGSISKVVGYLKDNKINTPKYYNAIKYKYNKSKILSLPESERYNWSSDTVREIIKKDEYLGVYRTAVTKSISFKIKRRFENKDCFVFEKRYEPLVDKDVWELAQTLLHKTKGSSISIQENIFKGLIYCFDCEAQMRLEKRSNRQKNKFDYRFYCYHKECEHQNSIPMNMLENIIRKELMTLKEVILSNKTEFLNFALSYKPDYTRITLDLNKELSILSSRAEETNKFIENLINQHSKGLIPQSTLSSLLEKYKKEKSAIDIEIQKIKRKIADEEHEVTNEEKIQEIINIIESANESNILRPEVVQRLISKIYIRTRYVNDNSYEREIDITIVYRTYNEIIRGFLTNDE